MNFQGIVGDFSSIKKDIMEDAFIVTKKGISSITIKMGAIYQNYRQPLFFYIFLCTIDIYIIFRGDEEDAPSQIVHLIGSLPHRDAQAYQHLSPFVLQQ